MAPSLRRLTLQRVAEVVFSLILCYHICNGQYDEAFEKVTDTKKSDQILDLFVCL